MSTSMYKKLSESVQNAKWRDYWETYREEKEKRMEAYYKIALGLLPPDAKQILDVGCGEGSFIEFIQDRHFIVGSDLSKDALLFFKAPKVVNDIANIPFQDRTFDTVTCLEVLEHLDGITFNMAISELNRIVTKYIIISVPNEESLEYSIVICPECNCHFNSTNHVRSFSRNSLIELFFPNFLLMRLIETGELVERPTYSRILIAFRLYFKPRPPRLTICPQCGFRAGKNPKKNSTTLTLVFLASLNTLKRLTSLIWRPKKRRHYILALYKRRKKDAL